MALIKVSPNVHAWSYAGSALTAVVQVDGEQIAVVLRGEADLASRDVLVDVLSEVIATPGHDVVVDIGGLDFIDSGSVGSLVAARESLNRQDRQLTVRSPSRMAARVLGLLDVAELIEFPAGAAR